MFFIAMETRSNYAYQGTLHYAMLDIPNIGKTFGHVWAMYRIGMLPSNHTRFFITQAEAENFIINSHSNGHTLYPQRTTFDILILDTNKMGWSIKAVSNSICHIKVPSTPTSNNSQRPKVTTKNQDPVVESDKDLTPQEKWDEVMGKN